MLRRLAVGALGKAEAGFRWVVKRVAPIQRRCFYYVIVQGLANDWRLDLVATGNPSFWEKLLDKSKLRGHEKASSVT